MPSNAAGQRAAAIDEDRRHVAADHAHHHAGQRLVAAAEADQRVIGEAVDHGLDRVGDQFAREQRELHALVVHADAVGDRDGGEFARRAAGLRDPLLGRLDLEIVGHVAGRLLALHADHADHRLGERRVVEPHRAHEGAVRRTIEAVGRHAGSPLLHAQISPQASRPTPGRTPLVAIAGRLLQRRDDGRMLELRDVHLRQHPGLGIDVEHLLDRREVRRGAGIAAEIVVLEQIGIEHRDRRLQHFRNDL